ncbi:DUF1616 domain-containing protein [Candidatus Bathyarchaeota archaeon]|nr:DUF1616 domain-containing protein [Candidatus Bathyarchaeota archaeon]
MQKRSGSVMRIGRRIGLSDEQGFGLPVLLALIVVIASVIGFYAYFVVTAVPEPYNTMYLLDNNMQAVDYAHTLVAGQNSTFNVNVHVDNHMGQDQAYQVQTKIAKSLILTPNGVEAPIVDTYDFTLPNGGANQNTVTVTENTPGSYTVIFELWSKNPIADENYSFTGNYCVLNIVVTE